MLHCYLLVVTLSGEALAAKLHSSRSLSAFLGNPFSLLMYLFIAKEVLEIHSVPANAELRSLGW